MTGAAHSRSADRGFDEDGLVLWQARSLHAALPLLCVAILANVIAMATAVLGDLPWWQQLFPPLTIGLTLLAALVWHYTTAIPTDPAVARRQLNYATGTAAVLGSIAGGWGVNAFSETELYYCMVAPVFLGLAALTSASCLLSVPRAAIAAMACTMTPIVIKMAIYDNLGVRAMAVMAVGLTLAQSWVVLTNFRQSRRTLELQQELERLASTDPLTGLSNRRAFEAEFDQLLHSGQSLGVVMLDLNGFKEANDEHGHHIGDRILKDIARRLEDLATGDALLARLGGDEFCLVAPDCADWSALQLLQEAIATAISQPLSYPECEVFISTSLGAALGPGEGEDIDALLRLADTRLYAHKRSLREMTAAA
jgi:diguanylate cyclase (GGDEF)-like protein